MWERIDEYSERLKVPNGWLIRYHVSERCLSSGSVGVSVAMIFIKDEKHKWKIK